MPACSANTFAARNMRGVLTRIASRAPPSRPPRLAILVMSIDVGGESRFVQSSTLYASGTFRTLRVDRPCRSSPGHDSEAGILWAPLLKHCGPGVGIMMMDDARLPLHCPI